MTRWNTAVVGLVVLAGKCGVAGAQPFPIAGIGNLAGGPSIAWGIGSWPGGNEPVVGETDTNNNAAHKACTYVNSGMAAVNNGSGPGGAFFPKAAYRINSNPASLIHVGSGQSAAIATRAFRCNAGVTVELGTINPFLQNSEARGVNFNGTTVGTCYATNSYPGDGNNNSYAFKWVPTSPTSNTGTMSMIPLHAAYDINDSNLVVGQLNGLPYQLNLNTSALTSMGSLGGFLAGAALSNNNGGVAVGYSPASNGFRHAFRWSGTGIIDIHPTVLAGTATVESFAYDINASNVIVGQFFGPNTGSGGHAFIYNTATGIWRDLNTWLPSGSGWTLLAAYGISDGNCVVGRGMRNGQLEGFKMCVIPPQPPQAPCGGGPLNPIPSQAACPGETMTVAVDTGAVGGGNGAPVEVEWDVRAHHPIGVTHEYHRVVPGLNTDPETGEPLFIAEFVGGTAGGASLSMTPIASPDGTSGSGGWSVRALAHGPCDTLYSNAAFMFVAAADVGSQGGVAGGDGLYNNNDFVVFIDRFFAADPIADMGVQGGLLGKDGMFDNNDFVVFIDQFFHACL